MKKLVLLFVVVLFAACGKERIRTKKCPDIACTENFVFVTIRFIDKDGAGVNVKNYSAVNMRTGATIKLSSPFIYDMIPGARIVVDDSSTKTLSEAGDDIKVSGTHPVSNQTKTAIVKVSGGKCACHINKISGPGEIQFD